MQVLVTGGAGYIGSVLVGELLKRDYIVTVVDSFQENSNSLALYCANKNFQAVKGDVRDEHLIKTLVKANDIIIPLAAIVGAPLCNQDATATHTVNYESIQMLSKFISKDQKVIFPCTNSGYGIGQKGKLCDETTPLNPISSYGKTKVMAEKVLLDTGNAVTLRLATVFGMSPCVRIDLLVNDFTYRALKDSAITIFEGHFKRNYIHVRDVVVAFLHAIDNYKKMCGEAYNVGLSTANLSKIELCEVIKKHIPGFVYMEAPVGEDPDKRDYIVSNDKLEATGWKPQYSLDDGIVELIKGYTMIRNSKFSLI